MHASKLSVLPALAALFVHSAVLATDPSASGHANVAARVATAGSMSIGSNGSALSFAASSQSAHSRITTSTAHAPDYSTVRAAVAGETATRSAGAAYNTSTGAGAGSALSTGSVSTAANGNVGIHGLNTGDSGGRSGAESSFAILAARNQGSGVQGSTASGFETVLSYDRTKGVTVGAATTGFVTGANATAALANMNAAAVAGINSTGYFGGTGLVAGSTGAASRP